MTGAGARRVGTASYILTPVWYWCQDDKRGLLLLELVHGRLTTLELAAPRTLTFLAAGFTDVTTDTVLTFHLGSPVPLSGALCGVTGDFKQLVRSTDYLVWIVENTPDAEDLTTQ